MYRTLLSATTALLLAAPGAVHGQATLQAGAGGGTITGDDFENVEAGYSVGGGLLFDATENIQVGGEVFVHSLGVEGTDENLDQYDVLAKARYVVPGETARLFIGAKAGYARQSFETVGVDQNSDGFTAGPTAGVQIPVSDLMIEISGDLMYVTQEFNDDELIDPDAGMDDPSGLRYSLEAGLAVPLGGR